MPDQHLPRTNVGQDPSGTACLGQGATPGIGLALGGGVGRGWAHIGVLRALDRLGVRPSIVAGTSIGALVGGVQLAGCLDALEDWARSLHRLRILSYLDVKLNGGGLVGGHRLVAEMRRHLGDVRIEQLPIPFAAVCTDLASGNEVWLRQGDLVDGIRASFSIPGVFPPVWLDERWLIDGAVTNPVPVSVCRALGARLVIAVNLNADVQGKAQRGEATIPTGAGLDPLALLDVPTARLPVGPRLTALTGRLFRREAGRPSLFGVMVSSFSIIMERLTRARLAGDPPDIVIEPKLGHIGLVEFDRAAASIEVGETAVERAWPEIDAACRKLAETTRDAERSRPCVGPGAVAKDNRFWKER